MAQHLRQMLLSLGLTLAIAGLSTAEGRRFAVIAGVSQYDHAKLERLEYAEDDAVDLAALLAKVGYEVTLLGDKEGKASAFSLPTKRNIEASLKQALDLTKREDTIVVALSGHGLNFTGGDSYFCPQDARPFADRTDSLVSLSGIYKLLDECGAGVKMLLVDACRNDPDPSRGKGIDADTAPRPPTGVAVLFSCSRGERSFEHDSLKHGIFTHFILEGLKGKAKDGDDEVTFDSLSAYVRKQTAKEVPKLIGSGRHQSPNMKADLSGAPAVLLTSSDLGKIGGANAVSVVPKTPSPTESVRPYVGVIPDFASSVEGFVLAGTSKGSPAEAAGIRARDVIVRLGNSRVSNLEEFDLAVRVFRVGDRVPVTVIREGKEVLLEVHLESKPATDRRPSQSPTALE